MRSLERSGTFQLGDLRVRRLGYGAMHLSGAGIFGPPRIGTPHWPCCVKPLQPE